MERMAKIDVLGTEYSIAMWVYDEKPIFKNKSIDGYCDSIAKEIAVCDMKTFPGFEDETVSYCNQLEKQILRHEIVHAFLNESGLQESGLQYSASWARNEEMIDWIALQFPKMLKAFKEVDAL